MGRNIWTKDLFLRRAKEIHGDKYDYNNIKEQDIINYLSKLLVICKKCQYSWKPTIQSHIYSKSNCPKCIRRKWN